MSNKVKSIIRDDFKLKYVINGNGACTIIIGSHIYYPRVFSSELQNKFKLVYMDHRGFASKGSETVEKDFELVKLLEDIEQIRTKLEQDKVTLIGHSIHAYLAIEYCMKYPEHVDRLILSATSPISGEKLILEANKYFEDSADPHRKKIFENNLRTVEAAIKAQPHDAFIIRMLKFAPMLWYKHEFDASDLWKGVTLDKLGSEIIWNKLFSSYEIPDMTHLNIPVLLLLGRYDYFNPPYLWQNHQSKFKDLTIRVFEKSGHTPSFEEPDLFSSEVFHWVNK